MAYVTSFSRLPWGIAYTLIHIMFLQSSSTLLDRQFLVPLVFIVTLRLAVDCAEYKANLSLTRYGELNRRNKMLEEALTTAK
jgi:hypothetical protein